MPAYARTALSTAFPIIHSLPSLAADKIPELSAAGPAAAPLGSPAEIFRAISFATASTPGAYRSAAKLPPRMSPIAQIATVLPLSLASVLSNRCRLKSKPGQYLASRSLRHKLNKFLRSGFLFRGFQHYRNLLNSRIQTSRNFPLPAIPESRRDG